MEHTSKYYDDQISEYKTRSEAKAQSLYRTACNGDITYTEAWYSLPGPIHVNSTFDGYQTTHDVTYQFLPKQDVQSLKYHMEREFAEAMKQREDAYNKNKQTSERQESDLKKNAIKHQTAYNNSLTHPSDLKRRIEDFRRQIANLERAYENAMMQSEKAKEEKEAAEKELAEYLVSKHDREINERASIEARVNFLAKFRDEGIDRQKKEGDNWLDLWKKKDEAVKNEKDLMEQDRRRQMEEQRRKDEIREFEKRIEEEAARRIKDSEFEELVRKKMEAMVQRRGV